jgi:response regulator NasT
VTSAQQPPKQLKVVVGDQREDALRRGVRLVRDAGHRVVASERDLRRVPGTIVRHHAELAVVAAPTETMAVLELIDQISGAAICPAVLLLEEDDPGVVRAALDHGLAAYATAPTPAGLQSAVELALHRFGELRDLRRQLRELEAGAERRALIECAKGVLMERHGVDERDAYELLRTTARTRRISVSAIADGILRSHTVLPGPSAHRGRRPDGPRD